MTHQNRQQLVCRIVCFSDHLRFLLANFAKLRALPQAGIHGKRNEAKPGAFGLLQVAPETLHGVTSEVFRLEALHHEVQATHEAQRGFRRFHDELHHNSGEQD